MIESAQHHPSTSHSPNMTLSQPRYVVITPIRDEETYIRCTLESMINQTVLPQEWIIVNDGSTDQTGAIVDDYASKYSWIRVVHRNNRGYRKAGGGVVDAFNDGYRALRGADWDFIVKCDGDLTFAPDYFEKCFDNFDQEPTLGVGGGTICHVTNGNKHVERCPTFHVRGATKIYRKDCWDAIGGFWPAPGWDTIDEVKATRLGWTTRSFPDLHLIHHRPTGTAEGIWAGLVKDGRADYVCGYHPLFMVSKCLIRLIHEPYVIGSIALLYGFVSGYVKHVPRVDDPATVEFLRQQQMKRLRGGDSIWTKADQKKSSSGT
ncbi:MAG: glycosyltransferase family A protein [Candidatus Sulfotelmatobacter sp.]